MGQFIILPDGRMWMGNGAALGTAGYGSSRPFLPFARGATLIPLPSFFRSLLPLPLSAGNETWAVGRSYADQPILQSWYFDPKQSTGSKWSKAGVSTVDRLYHSSATLLMDGSILVSGSNPNPDCESSSFESCSRSRRTDSTLLSLPRRRRQDHRSYHHLRHSVPSRARQYRPLFSEAHSFRRFED